MKKIYVLLLAIVITLTMCSCKEMTFPKQENVNLNYNNVVASEMYCWIEKDAVYLKKDYIFAYPRYRVTEHGEEIITLLDGGSNAMEYNDKLYLLNSGFRSLTEYDLETDRTKTFSLLDNVLQYFIIDDECFMLSGEDEDSAVCYDEYRPKTINKLSFETEDVTSIADNVFAFGVIENKCSYLTRDENTYNLYQYNSALEESAYLGGFNVELDEEEFVKEAVNFTSNYVVLNVFDYDAKNGTRIYIYDIENGILNEFNHLGQTFEIVAFDKFAYFYETYDGYDLLYRLNLETLEVELIDSFYNGFMNLFVTSDNDVYVQISSYDDEFEEGLFHYNGTNREKVMD